MEKHKAHIDYESKACVLYKGNKKITIQSVITSKKVFTQDKILSALQFNKAIKKGFQPLLVQLKKVTDDGPWGDPLMERRKVRDDGPLGDPPMERRKVTNDEASTTLISNFRLEDSFVEPLIKEYDDIFQAISLGLPPMREMAHTIPLEDGHKPPFRPIYRLSPLEIEEAKRQIKEYIHKKWIEPSSSPYGSPILFIKKKDDGLRMIVDYRALNKLTIKNRYPLPRIDDLFDQLVDSYIFSSLDLSQGYHQIRILEEDKPKTTFRMPFNYYQFKVLSFRLANTPATFQGVMNRIFHQYLGKFVLVYLDDTLVFSKTPKEHVEHLQIVFDVLCKNKSYAKLAKCHFAKNKL